VRVLESTPERTVLEWVSGPSSYENVPAAQEPMVASMGRAREGLRLEVILDKKGVYQGLRNQVEAEEAARKSFAEVRKVLIESMPEAARTQVEAMVSQALSPENAVSSAGADVRTYFAYSGQSFEAGEVKKAETSMPMIIGGGSAKMTTETSLKTLDENTLVIESRSLADPASLRELKEALAKQFLPPGSDSKVDLDRFQLGIQETVLTTIDRKTGLVLKREQDYNVEAGPARITMSNRIELKRE
jgi:hypothetical protein